METKKRKPILHKLSKQQQEWLDNNCCPICGLSKSEWKRRTDWRCCSTECTKKYSDSVVFIWQYFKKDAFKRDNYKCVKCGFAPKRKELKSKLLKDGTYNYFWTDRDNPDTSQLIGDHIKPIAIGGEEYDLDNVQTLCVECNKIKTKEDMREIALYRNKHPEQITLSG